ncbi:PREDICTED: uncharacterized protein LOC108565727 [Nicrophorus vespilloides]|uniref:Uncharacterized protein LOC108565727 n=1 Tax=Nicrophorus vespilloides TaxID=110193 RepID=A0ABM1N1V5_NICVS|nr:PREDICTED: uncharacterized protein LOC108565727 [Nicrophorus vespilloides]
MATMAIKTRTGICAIACTTVSFILVLVAFCTSYWLENDGILENPKFIRIGLWEVCLNNFEDINHHYDKKFTGCWWVFEDEYYIIQDFLWPGFFLATQFFFTLCITLLIVAAFLTWLYCFCSRDHDKYILLLMCIGADLIIAGLCGFVAILIFGIYGDRRDWMPNWEHNQLGLSFGLGSTGSLLLLPSGTLFLVEARRANYRRLQASRPSL